MLCDVVWNALDTIGFYEVKPSTMNNALTIKQAAEVYKLSVSGIYNLIKTGKLVAIHQDGEALISQSALESVLVGVCPVCGEKYSKANQRQRFCSQRCRQKANRAK